MRASNLDVCADVVMSRASLWPSPSLYQSITSPRARPLLSASALTGPRCLRTNPNVWRSSEGEQCGDWLDDYAVGTNFEIYSVPLEVLSGESTLWGMSFSRQA